MSTNLKIKKKASSLAFIWRLLNKLHAESHKLWVESHKLWVEGDKLHAESHKLHAEGDKLHAKSHKLWVEGNKLHAEGDKLWVEGVIEVYGNIKLEWKNYNSEKNTCECHLEIGDVFIP